MHNINNNNDNNCYYYIFIFIYTERQGETRYTYQIQVYTSIYTSCLYVNIYIIYIQTSYRIYSVTIPTAVEQPGLWVAQKRGPPSQGIPLRLTTCRRGLTGCQTFAAGHVAQGAGRNGRTD